MADVLDSVTRVTMGVGGVTVVRVIGTNAVGAESTESGPFSGLEPSSSEPFSFEPSSSEPSSAESMIEGLR